MLKVPWCGVGWYVVVTASWVALLRSDWLTLWGPGTSWHSYVMLTGWTALTVRRVFRDLEGLQWRTWWAGYGTCASDMTRKGSAEPAATRYTDSYTVDL